MTIMIVSIGKNAKTLSSVDDALKVETAVCRRLSEVKVLSQYYKYNLTGLDSIFTRKLARDKFFLFRSSFHSHHLLTPADLMV